ncbi:hypothetical protein [Campylobacter curvus]|uniref:Uncharacterized protein n=1 Tax=Campylobacter curvus (strain 525.92) TaxID=360105 RepID=A7H0W5_CAMC5|nr:hypothetical protein [Campylobacter curvus]EAU00324.1 hypothetical protein CCV52592_0053 [Campylobacter curvus 525.92]
MIAFEDIRDDAGEIKLVPFEYDETAKLKEGIRKNLNNIDLNLDDDEIYGQLDEIRCAYEGDDAVDVWQEIEAFIAANKNEKLSRSWQELQDDLRRMRAKLQTSQKEVQSNVELLNQILKVAI